MNRIDITYNSLFRILLVIVAIWALIQLSLLVVYLLFSILFAVTIHPLVRWFERFGLKRSFALAVVIMLMIALFLATFVFIAISLLNGLVGFWNQLPDHIESITTKYPLTTQYFDQIEVIVRNIDFSKIAQQGLITGGTFLRSIASIVNGIVIVFFLTVFISLEYEYLLRIIKSPLPKKWRKEADTVLTNASEVIGGYMRGQALTSFLMIIAAFIIYRVLGLNEALSLAIFAGLTDIIPIVGGFIGVVPAAVIGLTVSPLTAILVIILMSAYQTFNNNYITPRVYGRSMKLSPFLVMVTTTAGFMLFGMVGILLALPVSAIAGFILTEYMNIPVIVDNGKNPGKK